MIVTCPFCGYQYDDNPFSEIHNTTCSKCCTEWFQNNGQYIVPEGYIGKKILYKDYDAIRRIILIVRQGKMTPAKGKEEIDSIITRCNKIWSEILREQPTQQIRYPVQPDFDITWVDKSPK